jgi:hypothetical protein
MSWGGDWASLVWSSILPQGVLRGVGGHLRIEGGGGQRDNTEGLAPNRVSCSVSDRFSIRWVPYQWVQYQMGSVSDRVRII